MIASVAFLRGVNVGGRKAFQPSALARELAALDAVNVGAAGTFVIRKKIGQAALRAELLRRLPFEAELMICRAADLTGLVRAKPFAAARADEQPFVSVLARRPRSLPALPVTKPAGDKWQVKILRIDGPFALSLWRRLSRALLYPNEVVEKTLGVSATTRNWNTICAIHEILEGGGYDARS